MSAQERVVLMGAPGSPYTRKMLALLRYRRIPYSFLTRAMAAERGLPQAKVPCCRRSISRMPPAT